MPQLDGHRERFDPNNVCDFIDAYLSAAKDLADSGNRDTSLTGNHMLTPSCVERAHGLRNYVNILIIVQYCEKLRK